MPGSGALNTGGSSGPNAQVSSVSCPSAGNCAAGGYYRASRKGTSRALPQRPGWCASAGNSSAGGEYAVSGRDFFQQAFVAGDRNGTGGKARPVAAGLNRNRTAEIVSVSCASAGHCSAGGYYTDKNVAQQAFVAGESNGTWGTARPVAAGLNQGGFAQINSVSCASAAHCSAGGYYTDSSSEFTHAFVVSETNGTWGKAKEVAGGLNQGDFAQVSSVSCSSAGHCSAGGYYSDVSDNQEAFVVSET